MSFDEKGLALVIAGAVPRHVIMLPAEVRAVARRILDVFGPRLIERESPSVGTIREPKIRKDTPGTGWVCGCKDVHNDESRSRCRACGGERWGPDDMRADEPRPGGGSRYTHPGAGGGDDAGYMHPDVLATQSPEMQADYRRQCRSCKSLFRVAPDEWQCHCGGLVVDLDNPSDKNRSSEAVCVATLAAHNPEALMVDARRVACPACGAPSGEKCRDSAGAGRTCLKRVAAGQRPNEPSPKRPPPTLARLQELSPLDRAHAFAHALVGGRFPSTEDAIRLLARCLTIGSYATSAPGQRPTEATADELAGLVGIRESDLDRIKTLLGLDPVQDGIPHILRALEGRSDNPTPCEHPLPQRIEYEHISSGGHSRVADWCPRCGAIRFPCTARWHSPGVHRSDSAPREATLAWAKAGAAHEPEDGILASATPRPEAAPPVPLADLLAALGWEGGTAADALTTVRLQREHREPHVRAQRRELTRLNRAHAALHAVLAYAIRLLRVRDPDLTIAQLTKLATTPCSSCRLRGGYHRFRCPRAGGGQVTLPATIDADGKFTVTEPYLAADKRPETATGKDAKR